MNKLLLLTEEKMKKTLESYQTRLLTIRTGRASSGVLEAVKVDYYGAATPLNQMSSIIIPDAKTIEVKPYDAAQLNAIEKAILSANIGFTPQNDGKVIRLKMPPLTETRRMELVKLIKKMCEDDKIVLRQERRDAIENIKKMEKDAAITKDDLFKGETELQKLTDAYMKKTDEVTLQKEKEIMTV